jgi:hypothetical protein
VSVIVAVAFAAGAFRLMRALGVEGTLLPVALTIAVGGIVGPLAARDADGPSGAGYGMEPLALCLLIWCYDAFARSQPVRAGVLLGGAGIAHPLVFGHGLLVLAIATSFLGAGRWQRLGRTAVIALAVGAPATLQLAISAVDVIRMDSAEARRLVDEGYRFRFPNWYALHGLTGVPGLTWLLLVAAGAAGAVSLLRSARSPAARAMLGLIAGHAILVALAILCYTRRLPGPWTHSVAAHALDLTLTAPLLAVLAGIALLAWIEARVLYGQACVTGPALLQGALWASTATLLAFLHWSLWTGLAVGLGVVALVSKRTGRAERLIVGAIVAVTVATLVWSYRREVRPKSVEPEDEALYQWARGTPKRSLFIVPPTARDFRYYTGKGVVVDYDMIPPASPRALLAWRDRLDLVAAPDDRIRTVPAWRRPYAMDRSYAIANTPARAADLLRRLGVQYLVWDARGLQIPPFLPVDRPPDPAVTEVFSNGRYRVYALTKPDSAAR